MNARHSRAHHDSQNRISATLPALSYHQPLRAFQCPGGLGSSHHDAHGRQRGPLRGDGRVGITHSQFENRPPLAEWLDGAEAKAAELSIEQQANLREMRWHYAQAIAVPGDLVQAKTLAGYRCENQWREQRQNNDWQGFRPNLEAVIAWCEKKPGSLGAHWQGRLRCPAGQI